jgi:hypothetical protein
MTGQFGERKGRSADILSASGRSPLRLHKEITLAGCARCGWFLGTGVDHIFKIGTLLTLGTRDHIIHIVLGATFLLGGALGGRDR